jgi:hypothetical protein
MNIKNDHPKSSRWEVGIAVMMFLHVLYSSYTVYAFSAPYRLSTRSSKYFWHKAESARPPRLKSAAAQDVDQSKTTSKDILMEY